MQHQTVPQASATGGYRVAFDVNASIAPLTFPADATPAHITDRLHHAFLTADVIDDGHEFAVVVDVQAGTVVVRADGEVIEHGSITALEPEPDYWLTLADDLRQAADRLATLAGTARKPEHCFLSFMVAGPGNPDPAVTELVNAIGETFGLEAKTGPTGASHYEHKAEQKFGNVRFSAYAYVPAPEDPEKAALRAELEQLRAQLAQGGEPR